MTPCKELGYRVGDKFTVIEDSSYFFEPNDIVYLVDDDGSCCPLFSRNLEDSDTRYLKLSEVMKITETTGSSLEETFTTFLNSLGNGHDSELSIKKGEYTLYFDDYEFDGDEARIRKVIEMLTDLHIKG